MNEAHPSDRSKVIHEAYRIESIQLEDCRSIFLEWLLGLPDTQDSIEAAKIILDYYSEQPADHPMTLVLREAAEGRAQARRRGGAMGRRT